MHISQTKLCSAAHTLQQINAIASTMSVDDLKEINNINLWPNPLQRLKSLGTKSVNSKAVNLRNELNVLTFNYGFTGNEVEYIAETAIELAVAQMPDEDQFTSFMLNPMFRVQ